MVASQVVTSNLRQPQQLLHLFVRVADDAVWLRDANRGARPLYDPQ
jgi:hypothetical protein